MNLNKKRVLYFCSSSVYGGAERFVEECFYQHSEFDDMEPRLFFLNDGRFFKKCLSQGFHADLCPFKVRLKNIFSWFRFQFHFYSYLKKENIDVVHLTMAYSQIFASLAARLAGVKVVWFQHGPIGGVIDKVANLLPYDDILFNSEFTKSEHLKKAGKIQGRSHQIFIRIQTSFNPDQVLAIRREYAPDKGLIIATGRVCRWKGFETAIDSMSELVDSYDYRGVLLIVGEPATEDDHNYFSELKIQAQESSAANNIHFLGFKENIYDYIKASDFLIHSSTEPEPFGLVVAEAISLGTYVLARPLGGVTEQLKLAPSAGSLYTSARNLSEIIKSKSPNDLKYKENLNFSVKEGEESTDKTSIMSLLREIYYS